MRGARMTVAVTKKAPSAPPIQYHHGPAGRALPQGTPCPVTASTAPSTRVPTRNETKAAGMTPSTKPANRLLMPAWMGMNVPAARARRRNVGCMRTSVYGYG